MQLAAVTLPRSVNTRFRRRVSIVCCTSPSKPACAQCCFANCASRSTYSSPSGRISRARDPLSQACDDAFVVDQDLVDWVERRAGGEGEKGRADVERGVQGARHRRLSYLPLTPQQTASYQPKRASLFGAKSLTTEERIVDCRAH
eukprot:scaffold76160_cov30-Tisochrysis_lutea.AAC.1